LTSATPSNEPTMIARSLKSDRGIALSIAVRAKRGSVAKATATAVAARNAITSLPRYGRQ
jgi:hypothetical protein